MLIAAAVLSSLALAALSSLALAAAPARALEPDAFIKEWLVLSPIPVATTPGPDEAAQTYRARTITFGSGALSQWCRVVRSGVL
jgi:hypothetical protein